MTSLRNTKHGYGAVLIVLHWVMALLLIGLFFLGWYMTGLTYYDPLYNVTVELHESFGVLVLVLAVVRVLWAVLDHRPALSASLRAWEQVGARAAHLVLYLAMVLVPLSGYFISTADGRALDVFGLLQIPAAFSGIDKLEDIAGAFHYYLAFAAGWLVLAHAAAALKHHFIDKDNTLQRMLRGS